jgi:hypothetical protein
MRKAFTVAEIRAIRQGTAPAAELAAEYGVQVKTIHNIRAWRTWKKLDRHLKPTRPPRINARGDVRCSHCKQYLPAHQFRPHPGRPGKLWTYCMTCSMVREYRRKRNEPGTPESRAAIDRGVERKRRRRRKDQRDRNDFVRSGIELLGRRGFTKAKTCKLLGISYGNLLKWERGEANVSPNGGHRVAVALKETAYLAAGIEPCRGRRLPHPDLAMLLARIVPQLEPYPLRNRWRVSTSDERVARVAA